METFARWYPKLRHGGIIAGHDFCVRQLKGREEGVDVWPRPDITSELMAAKVPSCGVYACIVGEFCYRRTSDALALRRQAGGVALAALEAVEARGSRLQHTGRRDCGQQAGGQ